MDDKRKPCGNRACKKRFIPARDWQVYCSNHCANLMRVRKFRELHKVTG